MSLRLLQKSVTVDGRGEPRARGTRGRGRQPLRMSLQQFIKEDPVPRRAVSTPQGGSSSWDEVPECSEDHNDWDEPIVPVIEEHSWDESPIEAKAPIANTAPLKGNATNLSDSPIDDDDEELNRMLQLWLQKLRLERHLGAIFNWCQEQGASNMYEVLEFMDDLVEAVEFTKEEEDLLYHDAEEALESVMATAATATLAHVKPSGDVPPSSEQSTTRGRGKGGGGGGVGRGASIQASGGGFYGRSPSKELSQRSYYETRNASTLDDQKESDDADTGGADDGSFYSSRAGSFYMQSQKEDEIVRPEKEQQASDKELVKTLTNRELVTNYAKESFTRTATFEPVKKMSQSAKKAAKRSMKTESVSQCNEEEDAKSLAKQRFERQLQASNSFALALKNRDGKSVRELLDQGFLDKTDMEKGESLLVDLASEQLEAAITARDADTVRRLLADGRLKPRDRVAGETMLAEEEQRRKACAAARTIRAASEAPFDDRFGSEARKALNHAKLASTVEEGLEAIRILRSQLEKWEKREQAKASLCLVLANEQSGVDALKAAIGEADACGLSGEDPLVLEALGRQLQLEREQEAANEKIRLQAEQANRAEKRLQSQLREARDPEELERAIAECEALRVPIGDARDVVESLRKAEERREAASQNLQHVLETTDTELIKSAIKVARDAGVQESLLQAAEIRVVDLKRQHNATVELSLALRGPASRLEAAIADAQNSGVEWPAVEAAREALHRAKVDEQRQHEACNALRQATEIRDLCAIEEALQAADGVLTSPQGDEEVSIARAVVAELKEELRVMEIRSSKSRAEGELIAAINRCDFRSIQAGRHKLLELGVNEDAEVLSKAASKLDVLRDEYEELEAKECVEATEARIEELKRREGQFAGQANKKERAAIGKEIMSLRNDDEYLSAVRFLRDRDLERKRRSVQRAKTEIREAEKNKEAEQRHRKALEDLQNAMECFDEAAVRSLLDDDILDGEEVASAEAWLRDQAPRFTFAKENGSILEFSFRHLQKRDFFKAPVAINDFFTKEYDLREGSCFKLRVVRSCNSVLVTCRSVEYADAILKIMKDLEPSAPANDPYAVVFTAEVRRASNFSAEVEEFLPEARQDAANLRRLPSRLAADKVLGITHQVETCRANMSDVGDGEASTCSTLGYSHSLQSGFVDEDCEGNRSHAQRTDYVDDKQVRNRYYVGKGKAGMQRSQTMQEVSSCYVGTGQTDITGPEARSDVQVNSGHSGKGLHRRATVDDRHSCSGYGGQGKGNVQGQSTNAPRNDARTEITALPEEAVVMLNTSREKSFLFNEDLRLFGSRFPFVVEYNGESQILVRPVASVHVEERARARAELARLISHYFPAYQERWHRKSHLRVSEDKGACITMLHDGDGYLVDVVEDYPGQDFCSGEVIVEINGIPLGGLLEEEIEEVFGNEFADGASLVLLTRGYDAA